ncbi:MAG: hypothetical protein A3H98_05585 [Bacteroidetes bacterium RIFCSPLOWO2_02_FULL_36_8]|nr:MAG: hypothetical protein A3H98_05585 [Bacteroidetes bacterium RIFCSPLOWO2_02_FULL_36_8]OFY71653.1 MAG: hypothetical protein A3G23_00410 [Bacteroidetes bacterium RIFCSPLOWO2_12_FULL_37_12]
MKIGIIGLGPVGQILAVHLAEAGFEVALCDVDTAKLKKIQKEGIILEGKINKTRKFTNIVSQVKELVALDIDLLIFSVKVYQTTAIATEAYRMNANRFCVMSAQNGIDVEKNLSAIFGEKKTLRLVINFAGNPTDLHHINITFFNAPNYLASVDDSQTEICERISTALNRVSLDTVAVDSFQLQNKIWEKTILNSSLSALCGLTGLTMRQAMELSDTYDIVEQVIVESVKVAEAEDIRFGENFIKKCLRYLKRAGDHLPSLALDMLNNRQTEIDYFNGKIVFYGKKHYVKTPLNQVFTNLVHAHKGRKETPAQSLLRDTLITIHQKSNVNGKSKTGKKYFLGVDLGSYFTKITVLDEKGEVTYRELLKTMNRDKKSLYNALSQIQDSFNIESICATGYGREHFHNADLTKTEVTCASKGLSSQFPVRKNIIDIGAEDIKVIRSSETGKVEEFFMNNKCAAGTGAFIVESAERAEIPLEKMSEFASRSNSNKELNSFCTVFAKTEIMSWIFDDTSHEDIARGIYLAISNRINKIKTEQGLPLYLIGGVIAHHSYFKNVLSEKMNTEVLIPEHPQFVVSYGAALFARENGGKVG